LRVAGARVVTSADAGRHLASLAADPAFEGMRGKYFEGTREVKSSADSYDLDRARELWSVSERLCGLADRLGIEGR
ncbi:MAG: 3-oxoacyl-ACP reductase, partial [Deltaproteobacteria bacterium]|nr:3-oxoacyl-ACP reductase [Nannocystaceae bacterium]